MSILVGVVQPGAIRRTLSALPCRHRDISLTTSDHSAECVIIPLPRQGQASLSKKNKKNPPRRNAADDGLRSAPPGAEDQRVTPACQPMNFRMFP